MQMTHDRGKLERAARVTLWVLGAIALFYLLTEHQAHLFGWLPYLLILACPLMHIFMHGGHHRGHHHESPDDQDKSSSHQH